MLGYDYDPAGIGAAIKHLEAFQSSLKHARSNMGGAGEDAARFGVNLKDGNVHIGAASVGLTKVALAAGAGGAGIAAGLGMATKSAMEFDKAIAEVATINGEVKGSIADTKAQVLELSTAMGQDAVVATRALYDIFSSITDISKESALAMMGVAGQAAVAGLTDMSTSTSALTVAINSYNMSATDASHVSDVLFTGVKYGVYTFGEIGGAMGKVTGIAAAMKVPFEDLIGAVTTVSTKGFTAAESVTAVRSAMVALQKMPPELAAALKSLGYESGQAAVEALGFQGTLEALRAKGDDTGMSMAKMFGRVEAANAVLSLTGENAEVARGHLQTMGDVAGATGDAFAIMSETPAQKMAVFQSTLQATAISIGDQLLPTVGALAGAGTRLMEMFNDLNPVAKTAIAWGGVLVAGVLLLTAGIAGLAVAFGPTIVAMGGMSAATATLTAGAAGLGASLLLILGPLALAAAAVYALKKADDSYYASLSAQAAKLDETRQSLTDYGQAAMAAQNAGGVGAFLHSADYLGAQNRELILGTDAWLKYGLGVSDAVTSNGHFSKELYALKLQLGDGKISTEQYQAAVQSLASRYSEAAGTGAVLTAAERKVSESFRDSAAALLARDQATAEAIAQDNGYQSLLQTMSDRVAQGTISQETATRAIGSYVEVQRERIALDQEAERVLAEATTQAVNYSSALQSISGGAVTSSCAPSSK